MAAMTLCGLVCGIPEVQRQLASILYQDCMSVTGRTVGENAASCRSLYPKNPEVITSLDKPFSTLAGLAIMHGNLAPDTAVAKPAAIAPEVRHSGRRDSDPDRTPRCRTAHWANRHR